VDLLSKMQIPFWWKHYFTRNFDPSDYCLNSGYQKMVHEMIDEFGKNKYIANLGILPNIPVDHAKAFVDAEKNISKKIDAE
jgi:uroporphyrinogen decarboxylase